jgi:HAD superfamily hydrolase (TIGR01509 family)
MADAYPVLPGVVNRIQEIKEIGGRIAVASSSSRVWVEGHLRKRNLLQYFDATVCREDTLLHKPDPEPYLTALRRINSYPSYSFAIEDSPLGIEAAIGAGLKCIAVGCSLTKHMDLSKATHIVESLDQVSFTKMLNEN